MPSSLQPFRHTAQPDAWASLKAFTDARIALGSTGVSIPVEEVLRFRLAHAHARDAVHAALESDTIVQGLEKFGLPVCRLKSKATSRREYLQRPDLGRQLCADDIHQLEAMHSSGYDVSIIIADGLSATAIQWHLLPFLDILMPLLREQGFSLAPLTIVEQGRVAVADQVGFLLKARLSVILIGERPGLSAFDSMGAYITYDPLPGLTDERRNCISNIRPGGLDFAQAAEQMCYLISQCFLLNISGVSLKDDRLIR